MELLLIRHKKNTEPIKLNLNRKMFIKYAKMEQRPHACLGLMIISGNKKLRSCEPIHCVPEQ